MIKTRGKRISGTIGERYLLGAALPFLLVYMVGILKNGFAELRTLPWEAALVILGMCVLWFFISSAPARRLHPVALYDGTLLHIGEDTIPAASLRRITPLVRARSPQLSLLELEYDSINGRRTAVVLSKPDWHLLTQHHVKPRSLRLLLTSHPDLKSIVQVPRMI